jgi:hypothetical protein
MAQWYENSYECPECGTSWTDEWSCMCDDRCPECNVECVPVSSVDLSRPVTADDYLRAARLITGSADAPASAATDEDAIAYAEAMMEGGEHRFLELVEETTFIRRFYGKSQCQS